MKAKLMDRIILSTQLVLMIMSGMFLLMKGLIYVGTAYELIMMLGQTLKNQFLTLYPHVDRCSKQVT